MAVYFPTIENIPYEGTDSRNPFAFRHYKADQKIGDKTIEEHLRIAVAYWHTFCGTGGDPFGGQTLFRPWNVAETPEKADEKRLDAAFEFFTKLGVKYYCFHDRDIASEGSSLKETNEHFEFICKKALEKQKETGIKLLWGTANLFSHPRYMCGAATNPDPHVFAHAAAQVKKAIEMTHMLGGENYVFWGGREGYETMLNTDMKREQEHLARFMHMAVDHAKEIGFTGQFLIEPKPKEPTKHQYDFDSATVISFLRAYDLDDHFKLNIEANHATLAGHSFAHDLAIASNEGLLGSIDANRGDLLLGWDTDQFATDIYDAVGAMLIVLKQNGIAPGGLNFDAKVRRTSIDGEDLFHAHIGGMDTFALALKIAHKIIEDGALEGIIKERYAGFDNGIGEKIENGTTSFKELEQYIFDNGEPEMRSGNQEKIENILNDYILNKKY